MPAVILAGVAIKGSGCCGSRGFDMTQLAKSDGAPWDMTSPREATRLDGLFVVQSARLLGIEAPAAPSPLWPVRACAGIWLSTLARASDEDAPAADDERLSFSLSRDLGARLDGRRESTLGAGVVVAAAAINAEIRGSVYSALIFSSSVLSICPRLVAFMVKVLELKEELRRFYCLWL